MNGFSGNKKIIISIAVFLLIIAVLTGGLLVLRNNDDNNTPAETTSGIYNSEYNSGYENNEYHSEGTTAVSPTDLPAMNVQIDANEGKQIQAYISGKYYISATMYTDGVASDIDLAISGTDFHTTMTMEGMKMGILFRNDNVYLINEIEKKFIDFKSIAALTGTEMDFDMAELREIADVLDLSKYQFKGFDQSEVDLNGQTANCYRYYADELSVFFYFVDGELRQVDYGDANGEVATSISVKDFSPTIPSNMLSLIGLKQATIFDFFGEEFMQQLQ